MLLPLDLAALLLMQWALLLVSSLSLSLLLLPLLLLASVIESLSVLSLKVFPSLSGG